MFWIGLGVGFVVGLGAAYGFVRLVLGQWSP